MKFAVIGGDKRTVRLCELLHGDGHRVYTYALEKAELPAEIPKAGCIQGCVYGCDCVILPVPAENNGLLLAPYSSEILPMEDLVGALWPGQLLCGGKFSDETCGFAIDSGIHIEDLMRRRDYAVGNAALTAEGAIEILMRQSEKGLLGSCVLITGWGRIGKILSLRLAALGAEVAVAARRIEDRALAHALGLEALDYTELECVIDGFDYVVNTVPERVISEGALCCAAADAFFLELASPPGGFDRNLAENIGLNAVAAPGLPGKCAPRAAARLIMEAVYAVIEEQGDC